MRAVLVPEGFAMADQQTPPRPRWWEFALVWCLEHWWAPLWVAAGLAVVWLVWGRRG